MQGDNAVLDLSGVRYALELIASPHNGLCSILAPTEEQCLTLTTSDVSYPCACKYAAPLTRLQPPVKMPPSSSAHRV